MDNGIDGVNCSEPEVHLVGEIAMAFANLELFLEGTIWQLLAGDNEQIRHLCECLTAEMSFHRKVDAFSSL